MLYRLTDDDIRRIRPDVLISRTGPRAATFMTRKYIDHLLLSFYDVLNARAVRRKLCEYYASNALYSETVLSWSVAALPRNRTIRGVVLKALQFVLKDVVREMRRRVNIYCGQGIRGDGNYGLATRVGWKSKEGAFAVHLYTVALAWCGVDGCLMKPIVVAKAEAWEDLEIDLEDLISCLRDDLLVHGLSLSEAAPVFHSTDVFGKHRYKIEDFYKAQFPEESLVVDTLTPKGEALGAHVIPDADGPTMAVGEPVHDVIAVRKLASPAINDCSDFVYDWQDMIDRLSAPLYEGAPVCDVPSSLQTEGGRDFLRSAVLRPVVEIKDLKAAADQATLDEFRAFLQQPMWTLQSRGKMCSERPHPEVRCGESVDD